MGELEESGQDQDASQGGGHIERGLVGEPLVMEEAHLFSQEKRLRSKPNGAIKHRFQLYIQWLFYAFSPQFSFLFLLYHRLSTVFHRSSIHFHSP